MTFHLQRKKSDIRGTNAYDYIIFGENSKLWENNPPAERPSCKSRALWYYVGEREKAIVNCNYMVNSMMRFYFGNVYVSDNFQEIHYHGKKIDEFVLTCNSSLFQLFLNVIGKSKLWGWFNETQTFEVAKLITI